MARMYHPKTGAEIDWVPDVPETVKVFEASGWKLAPEPEEAPVGRAAEPVTYEPVAPKAAQGDYDSLTKDELAAELERRHLSKSGNKDELVARLEEDDET